MPLPDNDVDFYLVIEGFGARGPSFHENVPTFQRMASGATFKEISRGVFKTIEFLQPPDKLTRRFQEVAGPMAEQVLVLQRQIQNLRQTRDLLLPRLLSGQIGMEAV
jgi:type I restriction enzyme S subunit